jgi:predicted RNase H-like nuclease (RuvC/YqgF family)
MKTIPVCVGIAITLVGAGLLAAPVDDFKEAVKKEGCEAIPYSSLRDKCKTTQDNVQSYCKSSSKIFDCSDLNPTGLRRNIDNVKAKIADLKYERDKLKDEMSRTEDEAKKKDLDEQVRAKEKQIYDLEQKVSDWEKTLAEEQKQVLDRIYNGEQCLGYRVGVQQIFSDAKSEVKRESAPELQEYIAQLVSKYEAGESGHQKAIDNTNTAIQTCKSMR